MTTFEGYTLHDRIIVIAKLNPSLKSRFMQEFSSSRSY